MAREVESAGFTPRDVTATAVGTLRAGDDGTVLEWNDSGIRLSFDENALDVEEGQRVRVTGVFGARDEGSESVSVLRVSEVQPLEP